MLRIILDEIDEARAELASFNNIVITPYELDAAKRDLAGDIWKFRTLVTVGIVVTTDSSSSINNCILFYSVVGKEIAKNNLNEL